MSASQTAEATGSLQAPPGTSTNGKTQRAPRSRKKRAARAASAPKPAAAAPATAVSPAVATAAKTPAAKAAATQAPGARAVIAGQRPFPLADGLFQMLPNPGSPWTLDEGVVWLQAVAATLRLAYKLPGNLTVTGSPAAA